MADPIIDGELADGSFQRQQSRFRDWVGFDPRTGVDSEFPVLAGRYHLYVALACPWCHRAVIARELAGLVGALPISYLAPYRDARGWAFTGELFSVRGEHGWTDEYVDRLHGWKLMAEAYDASDPSFKGRITVPLLWDTHDDRIVNNDSADILRMMGSSESLGGLGNADTLQLYPEHLRGEIDALDSRVYETVNNGVYRAGFARRQDAYEDAFGELFDSLDWLEALLGERRYLAGDRATEADWRLFPTLVRFDEVYNLHFRCNRRRVVDYPHLWAYARELYQWPGVAATVAMDQIKRHYYTTHDELNPKKIIPLGPAYDWSAAHGRDR
jgi:putative glutathione S-transferase